MAAVHFDTHQFIKTLQDSGFEQKQAEAVATAFREAQDQSDPITRQDISKLEMEIKEVKMEIKGMEKEIKSDMQALEYRMTLKLGAMMAASITLVAAIIKLMDNA